MNKEQEFFIEQVDIRTMQGDLEKIGKGIFSKEKPSIPPIKLTEKKESLPVTEKPILFSPPPPQPLEKLPEANLNKEQIEPQVEPKKGLAMPNEKPTQNTRPKEVAGGAKDAEKMLLEEIERRRKAFIERTETKGKEAAGKQDLINNTEGEKLEIPINKPNQIPLKPIAEKKFTLITEEKHNSSIKTTSQPIQGNPHFKLVAPIPKTEKIEEYFPTAKEKTNIQKIRLDEVEGKEELPKESEMNFNQKKPMQEPKEKTFMKEVEEWINSQKEADINKQETTTEINNATNQNG